ncbi:MAG: hypothetical protein QOG28_2144, partial [Trebonia sp.]|nr:hypothetical protein [Trebonia sp.]
ARVTLRVDPARLYFFDPATGLATGWTPWRDLTALDPAVP